MKCNVKNVTININHLSCGDINRIATKMPPNLNTFSQSVQRIPAPKDNRSPRSYLHCINDAKCAFVSAAIILLVSDFPPDDQLRFLKFNFVQVIVAIYFAISKTTKIVHSCDVGKIF